MGRLLLAAALAAALLAAAAAQHSAAAGEPDLAVPNLAELPIVEFTQGARLQDLPGLQALNPSELRPFIDIALTPATIVGPDSMISFTNGLYRDLTTGEIRLFGPTVRIRAGDTMSIRLANNLTAPADEVPTALNGYHAPTNTNLHTHGLHDPPGVKSQVDAAKYLGQDNIFITLPAKARPEDEPTTYTFNGTIGEDHMPGLHWYHPHRHGSTTIQAFTANGLILVEDDPAWLPDENGCGEVWQLMEDVPEVIMHLALLSFAPPTEELIAFFNNSTFNASFDSPNPQIYSAMADPQNRLCCGTPEQQANSLPLTGSNSTSDFILINGGYQPVIPMEAGQFQRWRLINTGYRSFVDLKVVDPVTFLPTDKCELQLLAKDGIYLMEMPRAVDHIFLTSGNRAELLVRCQGTPGDKFILTSGGFNHSSFGEGFLKTKVFMQQLNQDVVAIIQLEDAQGAAAPPSPAQRACTPLRAGYASDLRDEALAANNLTAVLYQQKVGFTQNPPPARSPSCQVNGKNFSFPDPEPLLMPLGTVVEWTFENLFAHPVHLHVNPLQITKLYDEYLCQGCQYTNWFEVGDWADTIQIPVVSVVPGLGVGITGIRTQPGQYPGYSVMHCHFLAHEDTGCMKVVKWECPGYDEAQPDTCPGFVYPSPGTFPKGMTAEA